MPLTDEEIATLAEQAASESRGRPFPSIDLELYMSRWAEAVEMKPGMAIALPAQDLYRHFIQFLELNGIEPPTDNSDGRVFGKILRSWGFTKTRKEMQGRPCQPYRMDETSAVYFRAWLKENPMPPMHQGPFNSSNFGQARTRYIERKKAERAAKAAIQEKKQNES